MTRFAAFTGWELQALARGVDSLPRGLPEQDAAAHALLGELHAEFDVREGLGFTDPRVTRDTSRGAEAPDGGST